MFDEYARGELRNLKGDLRKFSAQSQGLTAITVIKTVTSATDIFGRLASVESGVSTVSGIVAWDRTFETRRTESGNLQISRAKAEVSIVDKAVFEGNNVEVVWNDMKFIVNSVVEDPITNEVVVDLQKKSMKQ